jgi:hypothetical protein
MLNINEERQLLDEQAEKKDKSDVIRANLQSLRGKLQQMQDLQLIMPVE